MMKRWMEYISVFGVLVCVGLLLYNMSEINKLSIQYNRLWETVRQLADDKKANTGQNELETLKDGFLETNHTSSAGWYSAVSPEQESEPSPESSVSYYSLDKTEYLENVLCETPVSYFQKSTEIPLRTYWEWEWEGPTISDEEAAQYDLVKFGYLMD